MNKEKSLIFPLVMGILSLILLGIYIWDSYYLQSSLRMAIFVVPVLSTVGIIFSLIVRKTIYQHRIIWLVGFLSCLIGLLGFLTINLLTWYYLGMGLG